MSAQTAAAIVANIEHQLGLLKAALGVEEQAQPAQSAMPVNGNGGGNGLVATAIPLSKVRLPDGRTGPEHEWGMRIANPPPRSELTSGTQVTLKIKDGRQYQRRIEDCVEYVENCKYPYAVCISKSNTQASQWRAR